MRIEYHRTLIADRVRNEALFKALKEVITPGKTVVADIGTGTGLLGLMAAKLGARDVYLYESAPVAEVAAEIIKKNNVKQCQLLSCHSTEMIDPPPADVIICETLGNYAFEEEIIRTINDARQRMLSPGGTIIPSKLRQYAGLVINPHLFNELSVWDHLDFDIDLTPAKFKSLNNIYVRSVQPDDLMAQPGSTNFQSHLWDEVDFTSENNSDRHGEIRFEIGKSQSVYGIAVWWQAVLTKNVSLSTAPDQPKTHWEQLYFPTLTPIDVKKGQSVTATIRSRTSEHEGTHISWAIAHKTEDGKLLSNQIMDLDSGYIE